MQTRNHWEPIPLRRTAVKAFFCTSVGKGCEAKPWLSSDRCKPTQPARASSASTAMSGASLDQGPHSRSSRQAKVNTHPVGAAVSYIRLIPSKSFLQAWKFSFHHEHHQLPLIGVVQPVCRAVAPTEEAVVAVRWCTRVPYSVQPLEVVSHLGHYTTR
eukprot:2463883-Amphidinium_carterae.1